MPKINNFEWECPECAAKIASRFILTAPVSASVWQEINAHLLEHLLNASIKGD